MHERISVDSLCFPGTTFAELALVEEPDELGRSIEDASALGA